MTWLRRRRSRSAAIEDGTAAGFGSPEYFERTLEQSGYSEEMAPEPWTITAGQDPFQIVWIDGAWVDDHGIHLAIERYARVDDGEGDVVCNTEAEIAQALVRYGADATDGARSARSLWEAKRQYLTPDARRIERGDRLVRAVFGNVTRACQASLDRREVHARG